MNKIQSCALVILALGSGPAFAVNIMLDFGATSVGSPYQTLSPGHNSSLISAADTSWNTINSATSPASLNYSDGSSAVGITLTLGQEATGGSNTVDFSTSISNVNLVGSGGAIAGQRNLLTATSIYGDNTSSTAASRDGFFGGGTATGTGAAIGLRMDGLAAGQYVVYVMARNTNSNATTLPMNVYATSGTSSGTFEYGTLSAFSQSNIGYASSGYTDQYSHFVNGENFVAIDVTIGDGDSLFLAVDGGNDAVERRGFLNMVQIVQVPEPASALLGVAGSLLMFRRRR